MTRLSVTDIVQAHQQESDMSNSEVFGYTFIGVMLLINLLVFLRVIK